MLYHVMMLFDDLRLETLGYGLRLMNEITCNKCYEVNLSFVMFLLHMDIDMICMLCSYMCC